MLVLIALLPTALACPADAEDVSMRAQRALDAGDLDAADSIVGDLGCVETAFPAEGAVAVHRLMALVNWEQRDVGAVASHLRATPNDGWEPEDPELARIAQSSRGTRATNTEALAIPSGWKVLIDGKPATVRPLDRVVVFQWIDPDQRARRTDLLEITAAIPVPPIGTSEKLAPPPKVTPWAGEPENLMLMAGIGSAIASGTLVTAGLVTKGGLPEPTGGEANPTLVSDVRARAKRANTLGYLGQGAGVLAIGLVVTSRVAF